VPKLIDNKWYASVLKRETEKMFFSLRSQLNATATWNNQN
jgi:hypothetical protein